MRRTRRSALRFPIVFLRRLKDGGRHQESTGPASFGQRGWKLDESQFHDRQMVYDSLHRPANCDFLIRGPHFVRLATAHLPSLPTTTLISRLARLPYPLTILVEDPRDRTPGQRDECQQAVTPAYTQRLVHLRPGQRQRRAKDRSHHRIRCGRTGGVFGECVHHVGQSAYQGDEESDAEEAGADDWYDPMNRIPRRPAVKKEADGHGEGGPDHRYESILGLQFPTGCFGQEDLV